MDRYIEFFLLGLLQGVFEWLPISSQGSLVLLLVLLLGFESPEAADISILLHLGSCLAVTIYFRRDIAKILGRRSDDDKRMVLFLIVASLATVLTGVPIYLLFREVSQGETIIGLVGVALIITGLAQRRSIYRRRIVQGVPSTGTSFIVGLLQGLSALPGLSRSGITIFTLLLLGFEGKEALRISYLLSIPASLLASFGLILLNGGLPLDPHIQMAIIASFISGLITIGSLIRISQKVNFSSFCILMGLIALISSILKFTTISTQ
ncbi:MAG: undecaprenyl-diphosphate phosphatase [Candidatus Bathyarchaeia archaeon]|nr:undecaprenyl-diphosphate phosphatase [Candidatus Bathyarchaeota archaeon]